MNKVIELFKNQKEIKKFFDLNDYNNTLITSSTPSHNILLTVNYYLQTNEPVIYVAPNLYKATLAYEQICDLVGLENVNFYSTEFLKTNLKSIDFSILSFVKYTYT